MLEEDNEMNLEKEGDIQEMRSPVERVRQNDHRGKSLAGCISTGSTMDHPPGPWTPHALLSVHLVLVVLISRLQASCFEAAAFLVFLISCFCLALVLLLLCSVSPFRAFL